MTLSPGDLGTWPRLVGWRHGRGLQEAAGRHAGGGDGDGQRRESRGRRGVRSRDLNRAGKGRASGFCGSSAKVESWAVEGAAGLDLPSCFGPQGAQQPFTREFAPLGWIY